MFCVVYEFKVKPGCTKAFEAAWAEHTGAIRRVRGSLGSRLHTTEDALTYIAYAQWPDQESWSRESDAFTAEDLAARARMIDSTESIRVVYKLRTVTDLLDRG